MIDGNIKGACSVKLRSYRINHFFSSRYKHLQMIDGNIKGACSVKLRSYRINQKYFFYKHLRMVAICLSYQYNISTFPFTLSIQNAKMMIFC